MMSPGENIVDALAASVAEHRLECLQVAANMAMMARFKSRLAWTRGYPETGPLVAGNPVV
jgi:hypothetical protein